MEKIIESDNYPLASIRLKLDDFELNKEAYVDTGATGHGLYIPENYFEFNKVKQSFFCVEVHTGDGKKHFWKAYTANIKIGQKEFISSVVVVKGAKKLFLGRDILDKVVSIFDGPNKKLILQTP